MRPNASLLWISTTKTRKLERLSLKQRMLSPSTGGGYFLQITKDAVSLVKQYDYSGKIDTKSNFQEWGTAGGFSGKKKEKTFISRLQITSHRVLFLV
jgi:hypothetical protein